MKRLYYFTDSYPFSVDYTWKTAEISEAAKQFEEVVIIPFTFKKSNDFTFAKNVRIVSPTLGNTLFAKSKYLKHLFSAKQSQPWFLEFFKALNKGKLAIVDWYLATIYSDIIAKSDIFKELHINVGQQGKNVLFFQWTMNNALLIPLLYKWGYRNIICRMHGYDLYEFRHNNYLPYKSSILKKAKVCTFISEHGRDYATKLYPFITNKTKVHYLGAKRMNDNIVMKEEKFHIVSVSRVIPLKRLELIIDALKLVNKPIIWTHIGDGYAFNEIKNRAEGIKKFNPFCEVEFLGWLTPDEIRTYFSDNGINALILVSETEGLPVVIMEAFSASIPVIATNVGGVSELVNSENGVLLPQNPEVSEIAEALRYLYSEAINAKQTRRDNALRSYLHTFDLEKNSREFINFLAQE